MRRKSRLWALRALLKPSCWLQNNLYSKYWDAELVRLINNESFRNFSRHTVEIGSRTVWISNHPYASFSPYDDHSREMRPKRSTVLWAWYCMERDMLRTTADDVKELEKLWAHS